MVWDEIDTTLASADENIVFQNDFLTPKYIDSINGFYVYKLVDFLGNPTPVVVDGDFYVGWLQTQEEFLNVGFDVNNNANAQVYYNVGGAWQQSALTGAIMIRPQVGGDYSKYSQIGEQAAAQHSLSIYPNPVSQTLHVQTSLTGELLYQVFDQSGRLVLAENGFNNQISVQQLSAGFYILKVNELTTGNVLVEKFIKEK